MSLTKFKVATFNAYNLVLPDVYYYGDRVYDGESYNRKVSWMAGQLRRMDADIVAFQEVFHPQAFEEVIISSGLYSGAFIYVPERIKDELGPLPALVSRIPVRRFGAIAHYPAEARLSYDGQPLPMDTFSRPVVWAQIKAGVGFEFMIFVVHLKSKRPVIPEDADPDDPFVVATGRARSLLQRAAEALALRAILVKMMQDGGMPVMILGDFNDTAHAVTSAIIRNAPPWHYRLPDETGSRRDLSLYNVLDIQIADALHERQFTHTYQGLHNSLDHIFVSDEFVRANPAHRACVESVRVFNEHLPYQAGEEEAPDWQSDHGQVAATILA